ncbi:hypothetical protein CF5_0001 [Staphylococcus phage CF5]|uniref:Uncharacterized protein n=1 Tax=Staphylococcus phage CF5 TaxID=3113739 RepID=A0AAX4J7P7_9CAUD|nr:hypothetical protein CF5_0001 [Staphylococcus phage CF5]
MELNLIGLLEYIKENDIQNAVFESKDTTVVGKVYVSYGIIKIEDAVIDDIFEVEEKLTLNTLLNFVTFTYLSDDTDKYDINRASHITINSIINTYKDVTIYCLDDKTGELVLVYKDGEIINE